MSLRALYNLCYYITRYISNALPPTLHKPTGPVDRYLAHEAEHWEMYHNDLYQVTCHNSYINE